jgi:large repetitive protein
MRFSRALLLVALLALVVVPTALAIRFTDDSYVMPIGTVGQSYSKQLNGAGGCGPALPYQYTLIGGKLPPGLSLSFGGTISGTPTQAGSFSFWVNLSDQNPPSADWCRPAEAQREFTIKVDGGSPPPTPLHIVQTALSPAATVMNAPYSFQFTAEGGGSQTWSLKSGSLPAGLQLGSNGVLSGTPTATGDFSFTVQVSDGSRSATQAYTLTVVAGLTITAVEVPAGEVSRPFQLRLAAIGGKAGYTWSLAPGSALPSGLTLDPGGVLTGTPTAAGTFPLKLTVTDALGFTASVEVKLVLAAKVAVATKALAAAKVGAAFKARLGATGGVQPRTWKIVQGTLPVGIHLNKRTGELSGTPRRAGRATITVEVADSLGGVARARFVLRVRG